MAPLIELKVDFFFSLNKYKGEVKAKAPGCGQNSAETSTFWTAGFSCNYRHFDDGFRVPIQVILISCLVNAPAEPAI